MEAKKRIDLGKLTGPVLVFGGPYSNLQALEALHNISKSLEIPNENILCTGDIVGYCAQPEECINLIRGWGIHSIAGNVELQIRNGEADCGCNFDDDSRCDVFSRNWYPYAFSHVSAQSVTWLHSLPEHISFQYAGRKVVMVHGSYHDTSAFIFESTEDEIKLAEMAAAQADVVLAGHCGIPFHSLLDDKCWINAGVIGMPANDSTSRVWYLLLDDQTGFDFSHKSYEYDHPKTAKLMEEKGLPASYARTLSTGLWDNCEILPPTETNQQGVPLFMQTL